MCVCVCYFLLFFIFIFYVCVLVDFLPLLPASAYRDHSGSFRIIRDHWGILRDASAAANRPA